MNQDQARIQEEISELEYIEQIFVMPGWELWVKELEARVSDFTDKVLEAQPMHMSPEEVEQKRGQIRELKRLLNKPNEVAEQIRDLRDQLTAQANA